MDTITDVFGRRRLSAADFAQSRLTFARSITHLEEDTSSWSQARVKCKACLTHGSFETATLVVIVLNLILVILETDAQASDNAAEWMGIASRTFLTIYTAELSLKFYVLRLAFFGSAWNILDFTVVLLDLLALALSILIDMPSFATLRVLRLARLARAFKAARSFPELERLLRGFVGAMKAIFWGMCMIGMLLLVWGIMAVNVLNPVNQRVVERHPDIYDGCGRCARAYASVFDAMLTMFQQVVAGDSWGLVSLQIIEEEPLTALFFLGIIITVNLVMLNLILSVIIEKAVEAAAQDQHNHFQEVKLEQECAASRLVELCQTIDADQSGKLTRAEFFEGYEKLPEFENCLRVMGAMSDDLDILYSICDQDGSGEVYYVEFAHQLRRMKHQGVQMVLFYVSKVLKHLRGKPSGDEDFRPCMDKPTDLEPLVPPLPEVVVTWLKADRADGGSSAQDKVKAKTEGQSQALKTPSFFDGRPEDTSKKYAEAVIPPVRSQEAAQSLSSSLSPPGSTNDANKAEARRFVGAYPPGEAAQTPDDAKASTEPNGAARAAPAAGDTLSAVQESGNAASAGLAPRDSPTAPPDI
eukprot:TRINITY_DN7722_c2_g1_i1.p1 TRINITY_DN7722_c2_g1~~TRINITY_DN7722_c2_g1_i1.p1  ORF type:complete len:584 (+),score=103.36 TRINITY_DN7722_c2_g1_i1:140-1891(+)